MSPRNILLALGAILLAAGLFLGLRTISAGSLDCGSVLAPSDSDAAFMEIGAQAVGSDPGQFTAACNASRSDAKPLAYGALGLGVLAGLLAVVAPAKDQRPKVE